MPGLRALLVVNEMSRFGKRDGERVCTVLEQLGIECVREPDDPQIEAAVAAGGDGTVSRVAAIALRRRVPLGIVPLGTFNDAAKELAIPLDLDAACRIIAAGRTRTIDIATVNGKYYLTEASIGLSTRIARKQTPENKQRFGFLAVLVTTLRSLRSAAPFHVRLRYDGNSEVFQTIQLTVANSGHFGGFVTRADAAIDDGWLDLYSFDVRNLPQAFRLARRTVAGDPSPGDGLRCHRSTRFEVVTRRPHHIVADGEPAGKTPATFEILPRALRVFVPG